MTRDEFLASSGLELHRLEICLEQRWLIPAETAAGATFSDRDLARAGLIRDLDRDLGVNDEGIDVVLHLVDQLHGLRQALALLREEMGRTGG